MTLIRLTPRRRRIYLGGTWWRVLNLGWWWLILRIERKGQRWV